MEITGKLIKVLDAQRFVSKRDGSEIVKTAFVIETQGQYPKKVAFTVIGEEKFRGMGLVVGNTYNVSFDIESREWQGRWFTDVNAWRALCVDGQQQQTATTPKTETSTTEEQAKKDDLPF